MTHEQLEKIVDRYGLSYTLELLAEICWAKAEHLRSNWQDERAAKTWDSDGKKLDTFSNKVKN